MALMLIELSFPPFSFMRVFSTNGHSHLNSSWLDHTHIYEGCNFYAISWEFFHEGHPFSPFSVSGRLLNCHQIKKHLLTVFWSQDSWTDQRNANGRKPFPKQPLPAQTHAHSLSNFFVKSIWQHLTVKALYATSPHLEILSNPSNPNIAPLCYIHLR